MSLLKQDTIKKKRIAKKILQLEFEDDGESKKYKVEAIYDSTINAKELENGYFPGLYYLIFWRSYYKKKIPGN